MSLIPFILDLAEELHDFNRSLAMDIDDVGFGMYPLEQLSTPAQPHHSHPQLSPSSSRRATRLAAAPSSLLWVPIKAQQQQQPQHRHHPYNRVAGAKTVCCNKSLLELEKELTDKVSGGGNSSTMSSGGVATQSPATKSAYSVVNRNGFQVSMNVKQFAPDELTVKTIDNCIVVEGQHDEKEDGHGVISRHFIRKYMLPKGFDPNDVHSTLSSDGILTVKAPPPPSPTAKASEERIVDIQQSGGPAQLQLAQTPKTVTTNNETEQQQQQPTTAAAVEKSTEQKSDEERNGNATEQLAEGKTEAPAEATTAANAKETDLETSNGVAAAADAAVDSAAAQEPESMEVTDGAAAEATTAKVAAEPKTEDANANEVSNVTVANNGNTNNLPEASKDVNMLDSEATTKTAPAATEDAEKVTEEKPVNKGAEELAAVDAAILLAKNQTGENGAVDSGAAKTEELAK